MNILSRLIHNRLEIIVLSLVFTFIVYVPTSYSAEAINYNSMPPFLTTEVEPNVMVMLDNSGSMKNSLYDGGSWNSSACNSYGTDFNPATSYYGVFDENSNYIYDTSVGIDFGGYDGSSTAPYEIDTDNDGNTDSDDIDADGGAFVASTCTPGTDADCWSGNFLNWLVTRRIDAARKVMIGGKLETRTGYDYDSDGNLEWKIVGNSERSDRLICKYYASGGSYSPFADASTYKVYSPAEDGSVQSTYDPYAKLEISSPSLIVDSSGSVIGEAQIVKGFSEDAGSGDWLTVHLDHDYTNPVVIATPISYEGNQATVLRVSDVDASSDTFKIRSEEWEYLDGAHADEDFSYVVIEAGTHTLSTGEKIVAGTVSVNASTWQTVSLASGSYSAVPVVLTNVVTNNDSNTVTTRQNNGTTSSFEVILQEEASGGSHANETVAYVAFTQGSYNDGAATSFQVSTQDINDSWETISFTNGGVDPFFLASMQTYNGGDPASLRYDNLGTSSVQVMVQEEQSGDSETSHTDESVGYVIIQSTVANIKLNIALLVDEEPTGLLQSVADRTRMGITFYKYTKDSDIYNSETIHGGTMNLNIPLNPFIKNPSSFRTVQTPIKADIDDIVDAIEHYPLVWGTTPLAENYFEVVRYFQQVSPYYDSTINSGDSNISYSVSDAWDPYYFDDPNGDGNTSDAQKINCVQSNILLFTDGEPYRDAYVPDNLSGYDIIGFDGDTNGGDCFSTNSTTTSCSNNLDDLSKWAHCADSGSTSTCSGEDRDLRSDLSGEQNLTTYTVAFGQSTIPTILQDTADYGGGIAYAAEDGAQLATQLTSIFEQILGRSSGTAASVISNTRSGEGAIYQSVFFPLKESVDGSNSVAWVGQTHALFIDSYGYMREDTNDNQTLDLLTDRIVTFNEDGTADVFVDANGNYQFDSGETDANVSLDDLEYLWDTSSWLNEITDANAETQRSTYISSASNRYIFTWIDDDNNGLVGTGEVIDFVSTSTPSASDLVDTSKIYPYLHLYPSFANIPTDIAALGSDFSEFLAKQSRRQINYIRGSDCANSSASLTCNTQDLVVNGTAVSGTAMRSRQFDYDGDGNLETWRLGDIVYSTPTSVGAPVENFHLLYSDSSYSTFVTKYTGRRTVVYAGANDGMLHAFNGGFYNSTTKSFCVDEGCTGSSSKPVLGAELWAYVPYNLLPHLGWLTDPTYNEDMHVYYVDQKPRVFDAKIFPEESACGSGSTPFDSGCIHPNGWGTVMVVGMRLGGGSIVADMDKTDGTSVVSGTDRTMKSAFIVMDITDPESAPTLLAELVLPKQGFTTSYPTVVALNDSDHDGTYEDYNDSSPTSGENRWFLAFGSGPADADGNPGSVDTTGGTGDYDNTVLDAVISEQAGQFYLVDLVKLASGNTNHVFTLNSSGVLIEDDSTVAGIEASSFAPDTDTSDTSVGYDANTFISDPVTVDFDLDYNADALYFGTVTDSSGTWTGKMRRIIIDDLNDGGTNDDNDPANWVNDSVLYDVGRPIVAAPAVGQDDDGRHWVFFGTGRYYSLSDKIDTTQQGYYGIKEPLDGSNNKDWSTIADADLEDVSNIEVYTDKSVTGSVSSDSTWSDMLSTIESLDGWMLDFPDTGERNLGQATLLGGALSFTTFIPDSDLCAAGGSSALWGLYYKSGTAYYGAILGTEEVSSLERAVKKVSLGQGLATSPNVHVGRSSGSTIFSQSSTGEISRIEQENPLATKSGLRSWRVIE